MPEPFAPRIAQCSPGFIVQVTPLRMGRWLRTKWTLFTERIGGIVDGELTGPTGFANQRQVELLEAKAARLATMIDEAKARWRHLDDHLAELDGGQAPHPVRTAGTAGTGEGAP